MSEFGEAFDATNIETAPDATARRWALVEIFGHRQHYGEIREIRLAGAEMLEVWDADTNRRHCYGGAAIFSCSPLTDAEMAEHVKMAAARRERDAQFRLKYDAAVDDDENET